MDSLPSELVLAICAYLDEVTLARLSATSTLLHTIALDLRALTRRFDAQPLSYPMRIIARALLFRSEVPRTEILRFIADAKRAVALYNEVLQRDKAPAPPRYAYCALNLTEDTCWNFFWTICATKNVYLAQAYYFANALQRSPRWKESSPIYFDLLFRHGMWKEAERSLSEPLGGHLWDRERIPEPYRTQLFDKMVPRGSADVAGFRRVRGAETIALDNSRSMISRAIDLVLCPYVAPTEMVETLRDIFARYPPLRHDSAVIFAIRTRRTHMCDRDEFYETLNAFMHPSPTYFLFRLAREGRWYEDTSVLAEFIVEG